MDTSTQTTATAEQVTLVQIDPTKAVVGLNVRSEAALTPEFVSSIRERGVLEPVIGHYDEQGRSSGAPSRPSRPSARPSPPWWWTAPRTWTGSWTRWPRTTTAVP